jgi:hypothetical protein
MPRLRTWTPALLALVIGASGCTSAADPQSSATATPAAVVVASCDDLPRAIAQAVQTYVDGFADVEADAVPAASASGLQDFRATSADLRSRGEELGCDPEGLAAALREELASLRGGSPVQDAVLATLVADPLGTIDPADPSPVDIEVSTVEDLVAALSLAGSGSTISIAPGTYVVAQPLVALRPVTLVGGGVEKTILRSSAAGAALLIDADGDVAVRDLSLEHDGSASASVVIVTGGGYELDNLQLAGATAAENGAGGFALVLRTSPGLLRASGSMSSVSDVVAEENDGGGIFVGSDASPTLRAVSVSDSGGCGLCFVETSAGEVTASSVTDVPIGVRVDDAAAPELSGLEIRNVSLGVALTGTGSPSITGSRVTGARTGFEVVGSGSPSLTDTTVSDSVDIAVRLAGATTAAVSDLKVDGSTAVGIGIADEASPALSASAITTTGDVGVIWAANSGGTAVGLTVSGSRLGLQLSDSAAPVVRDVTVRSVGEASLLASGASSGRITRLVCPADAPVALTDDTTTQVRQSPTCAIADAR